MSIQRAYKGNNFH